MVDDARKQLQDSFAKIGERALARLHEIHPQLQGKTLEDTVAILKIEERLKKWEFSQLGEEAKNT
jgi:hypothetical protein